MANHAVRYISDIALLTLNDGENRFNLNSVKIMKEALHQVERNVNARALIITGTGKFFSNGLDLQWLRNQDDDTVKEFMQLWKEFYDKLTTFPVPTVAAINGHAFGAGAYMALLCDKRVMRTQRGWLCIPATRIGVQLPSHLLEIARVKCRSPRTLRDMVLFATRFDAVDALQAGIVDEIVHETLLLKKAIVIAKSCSGRHGIDRSTLTTMKKDLYKSILESATTQRHQLFSQIGNISNL